MPRLTYQHERSVEVGAGTTVLEASLGQGIPHTHACGGHARCSTCRVLVLDGLERCTPRTPDEATLAERLRLPPEVRLACQTRVQGDVTLRRLVLDEDDAALVAEELRPGGPRSLGEERELAILVADVRDFTRFAESHPAYDVIHVLNRYFQRVGPVIARHGGRIDNYMGDGILALFGDDGREDAALRAVRAALDMLQAVEALRPHVEAHVDHRLRIGIGVHVGVVVVGAVGCGDSRRLTVIGDAVNVASRIESATKEAGASLLVSEAVHARVRDHVRVGRQVRVPLKGTTGVHALYEVIA